MASFRFDFMLKQLFIVALYVPLSQQYATYEANDPVSKRLAQLIKRVRNAFFKNANDSIVNCYD